MFDAGAIQAHLDLETSLFDRKLTAAENRVRRFEQEGHKIRLSAVFDNASIGRARQLFTQLDNQLSREAMMRLRSSPQGSVLGALNALFSPHPVTGGPSPQQAATSGLLGRMIAAPGGGLPGGGRSSVSSILLGQAAPGAAGMARIKLDNSTISDLANAIGGQMPATSAGPDPGVARVAENTRKAAEAAERAAANSSDAASAAASAARDSSSTSRTLLGHFGIGGGGGGLLGFFGGRGGGAGRSSTTGFIAHAGPVTAGLASGIGPGILGINARMAGILGLGGSALGALPALIGGVSPLIGLGGAAASQVLFKGVQSSISPLSQLAQQIQQGQAAGLGGTAAGRKQLAQQQAQLNAGLAGLSPALRSIFNSEQQIQNWWQSFTASFAPSFAGPLHQVAGMLQGLSPILQTFFRNALTVAQPLIGGLGDLAHMVLPLLGQAFAAAAPLLRPVIDGLGSLLRGILPGLTALLRAAAPAVHALAGGLSDIGAGVGKMLSSFAPVVRQSATILSALLDVLSAIFPIVGQLASIFARALAPVFVQFAGVIRSLLPFLTTIGNVLASLAGAVLTDLVSAFGALAQLLTGISPALNAFARAFSQIFNVLENTGVFAIVGNAIEAMVGPLTTLINSLLNGLTPILPPLISFIGQLSSMLAAGLARAITVLLPPLTKLADAVLGSIAQIMPIVLPLFIQLTQILTAAFIRVVTDLATALSAIIQAIPPSVLKLIVDGIIAVVAAIKLWAVAQAAIDLLTSANPIGVIILAVAALAVGIVELAKHWRAVWSDIKNIANDAWHFLGNVLHNGIVQDILDVQTLGLLPLAQHWREVFTNLKNWAGDFWKWLRQTFGTDIANFFTQTLPGWFGDGVSAIGRIWTNIQNIVKAPIKWVADHVLIPLFNGIDDITNFVGLNHPLSGAVSLLSGMQSGGRIPGYGGGDKHLRLLEGGEAVVDKDRTRQWAWLLRAIGVPGMSAGGFVNPVGLNLRPERVDMGVDYGGNGPLYALGSGVITSLYNRGWPGGGFIGLHLDQAPPGGVPWWYYAEDVSPYKIGVGSRVSAGQYIAQATGGPSGIEVGYAAPPATGNTMASATGESRLGASHGDPGEYPTGWGVAASNLIKMLGGRPGLMSGQIIQGGTPGIAGGFTGIFKTIGQILSGIGRFSSVAIDLATGNVGGALSAIMGLVKPGAGGAAGQLATTLLDMPGTLARDALHFLVSAVEGFVSTQQASAAVPSVAATGPLQQFARKLVDAMWGDAQWPFFADIVRRESGWNVLATNPSSDAYGIPQALPGSKMASAGADWRTNGYTQLKWMVGYLKSRWGTPANADANEVANHWYGRGGVIREPVIGFGTRSGDRYVLGESGPEVVSPVRHGSAGAAIGNVFIQLPEGQTVARALTDLNFWLSVARQQGWAGGMPGG